MTLAIPIWRRLLMHEVCLLRPLARDSAGSSRAARMAMMAMTTSSSISVKPFRADFDIRFTLPSSRQRRTSGIDGIVPQDLLDTEQLIVFGQAIAAAKRTRLNLTTVRGHRDIGNGGVLGFTRAMAQDRRVTGMLRQLHG